MTENTSGVKTVLSEAIRLTHISIKLWVSKQITKDEMDAYQKRVQSQLGNFEMSNAVEAVYSAIETDMGKHEANHD